MRDVVERVWFGDDIISRIARAALAPTELLYRSAIGVRSALYETGVFATHEPALPTVSIGNLTVGGTGKTPIAAWVAAQLVERGARPAVVLRGYGNDEPLVHARLNADVPVIVCADRLEGVRAAQERGATVAVLDDAFQHRRVSRVADLVLVSADRWSQSPHLLPAGPWREPLASIRRATLVLVTRKAASTARVNAVNERLAAIAPRVPRSTVDLIPDALVRVSSEVTVEQRSLSEVAGRTVRVITGIGDPQALASQLEQLGAQVSADVYPDHHEFQRDEIRRFAATVPLDGLAVCTLKDAVKLANRWPREAPTLWYVSQRVSVERGVGGVEHILDELTRTRDRHDN
jgi:tetraacyldisaccharide 4'-kinase